jgi:hypothetical protein
VIHTGGKSLCQPAGWTSLRVIIHSSGFGLNAGDQKHINRVLGSGFWVLGSGFRVPSTDGQAAIFKDFGSSMLPLSTTLSGERLILMNA